jgi:hypothetical protein
MGQSYSDIILGLAQLEASRANTAAANRRLDIEDADKRRIQDRADAQIAKDEAKETARKAYGAAGFGGLRSGLESQLRQGLITYDDASSQLRDFGAKYELDPEEAVNNLTGLYTKELLPGRRATGTEAAYQELLGRSATEEEKKTSSERFNQGYYSSVQDLKDSLLKGSEYQDKFQTSYLGNYYDTMYGKEERDTEGKRTGKRAFKFDTNLLPTYAAGTEGKAGVSIPKFGDTLSGTPAELEEQTQNIRDTRKYLYSAGLTKLQGDIDKETQKLKNEGAKDIAKISSAGDIYKGLVGSFNFT